MLYNKDNFHNSTFCIWKEVNLEEIKGFKINYKSKSGSSYIFNETGVYRISNHWGRASNCRWKLNSLTNYKNQNTAAGYAKWIDFLHNDSISKLFFIKVDFDFKNVDFFHKNSPQYDGKAILRNANKTSKNIQHINIILNEESWSKHLNYDNFVELQKHLIFELIYSDYSLAQIKRKFFKS